MDSMDHWSFHLSSMKKHSWLEIFHLPPPAYRGQARSEPTIQAFRGTEGTEGTEGTVTGCAGLCGPSELSWEIGIATEGQNSLDVRC